MAESTTLPLTFAAALKQTFRSYTVDMLPTDVAGRCAVRLVSHDGPSLHVGFADVTTARAELCTLGHALSLSKTQIGRELRLPPVEYLRFVERATQVLESFGYKVTVVSHVVSTPPKSARPIATPYYGIIAASASLLGAIAWLIAN